MCLQLVELVVRELVVRDRGRDRGTRMRLSACIDLEGEAWMSCAEEVDKWVQANGAGRRYFQQHGYGVFEERPLAPVALDYADGDVNQMLQLWDHFYPRLTAELIDLVAAETKNCLLESMLPNKPDGSGWAPQSIRDLPIIPYVNVDVPEVYLEYSESFILADDEYGWTPGQKQGVPDWEGMSLQQAGKTSSAVAVREHSKSDLEGERESASPNSWDTFRECSGEHGCATSE